MENKNEKLREELQYPGVAVDEADKDQVTEKLERQYTCELNNNPRNTDE